jgi:DMSO/TMAO reductase YedYZ molybdopterin-dependent catalytic subunit
MHGSRWILTRRHAALGVLLALACGVCACQEHRVDGRTGATPHRRRVPVAAQSLQLEVTGPGVGQPTVVSYADLCTLDLAPSGDVLMQRRYEPDITTRWRGPPLDALLRRAQLQSGPMDVTLKAHDGYSIRCQLEDLAGAIVAVQDGNGAWLADLDATCPLRLVPPRLPGNYWVQNLTRVTVEPRSQP